MSIEFQYISIQLLIKSFFLLFLLLLGTHFQKEAKRLAAFVWLTAAAVFINILISIPLPFQFNAIGFSFMSTHILALMTINFMRVLSVQFMPFEAPDRFVQSLKEPKVYMAIAGVFILLVATIVIITGFGVFIDPDKVFYVFVSMDAASSTVVSILWAYYFYGSFKSIVKVKSLQSLLLGFLLVYNLFYSYFFLKILEIIPVPDSPWNRVISLGLYVMQVVFMLVYLSGFVFQQKQKGNQLPGVAISDDELKELKAISHLHLSLTNKAFILKLSFSYADGSQTQEELILQRHLKPFAYWLQFALAGQNGIWLTHADISVIKYRMVEFWNKSMTTKISQEHLFRDSRIQYALLLEPKNIVIDFDPQLKDHTLYEATFKEFYSDFLPWLKENHSNGTQKWTPESAFLAIVTGFK